MITYSELIYDKTVHDSGKENLTRNYKKKWE